MPRLREALVTVAGDPERMARFFAATATMSSTETEDELLKRMVHAARALAHADAATLTLFDSEPPGRLIGVGRGNGRDAVTLERELRVADRAYATLRLTTTRPRFSPEEVALVDLLCIHSEVTIDKVVLREREEVLERVRALLGDLEEPRPANGAVREVDGLRIDLARYEVTVAGTPVHLTPSEFRLLELLTEEPGRAYTRHEIVERLWNAGYAGNPRVADTHVARLRRKLERDPHHPERLQHVRGVGYRIVAPAD